jgi:hypothetical protein
MFLHQMKCRILPFVAVSVSVLCGFLFKRVWGLGFTECITMAVVSLLYVMTCLCICVAALGDAAYPEIALGD